MRSQATRRRGGGRRGSALRVGAAAGFLALVTALAVLDRTPWLVPALYVLLSIGSFRLYASDKSAARRGTWRVSESTLHLVDLVGGWPGGLVARHTLRHKTSKQPFRLVFWGTVVANVAVLAWLVVSGPGVAGTSAG